MLKTLKIKILLTSIVLFSFFTFAYASIGGDDQCGGSIETKCDVIKNGVAIIKAVYSIVLTLSAMGVVIYICYLAWRLWATSDSPGERAEVKKRAFISLTSFIGLGIVLAGFYAILHSLGVADTPLIFIKQLSFSLIPHAYAAENGTLLPNFSGQTDIVDFFINVGRLTMSWFIYPLLIASWVWTGFSYVAAQGNPEALKKAHKRLLYAAIFMIVVLTVQGFVGALRNTVQESFSSSQTGGQVQQSSGSALSPNTLSSSPNQNDTQAASSGSSNDLQVVTQTSAPQSAASCNSYETNACPSNQICYPDDGEDVANGGHCGVYQPNPRADGVGCTTSDNQPGKWSGGVCRADTQTAPCNRCIVAP